MEIEITQGTNLAKAAAKTSTLKHYIWSTLPNGMKVSDGKYLVPHFDAKNKVDDYIKADTNLYAKTTFLWVTYYASNYLFPMFTPNIMVSHSHFKKGSNSVTDASTARKHLGSMFNCSSQLPQRQSLRSVMLVRMWAPSSRRSCFSHKSLSAGRLSLHLRKRLQQQTCLACGEEPQANLLHTSKQLPW